MDAGAAWRSWFMPKGQFLRNRQTGLKDKRKKRGAAAPTEGSPGWRALEKRNELDMKLYRYAIHLYGEQKAMFD